MTQKARLNIGFITAVTHVLRQPIKSRYGSPLSRRLLQQLQKKSTERPASVVKIQQILPEKSPHITQITNYLPTKQTHSTTYPHHPHTTQNNTHTNKERLHQYTPCWYAPYRAEKKLSRPRISFNRPKICELFFTKQGPIAGNKLKMATLIFVYLPLSTCHLLGI